MTDLRTTSLTVGALNAEAPIRTSRPRGDAAASTRPWAKTFIS
ncbi:hypothetical protein [Rhodococcus globerulus]|nr:hypothetical protein [Rhodococcus globerulus]